MMSSEFNVHSDKPIKQTDIAVDCSSDCILIASSDHDVVASTATDRKTLHQPIDKETFIITDSDSQSDNALETTNYNEDFSTAREEPVIKKRKPKSLHCDDEFTDQIPQAEHFHMPKKRTLSRKITLNAVEDAQIVNSDEMFLLDINTIIKMAPTKNNNASNSKHTLTTSPKKCRVKMSDVEKVL